MDSGGGDREEEAAAAACDEEENPASGSGLKVARWRLAGISDGFVGVDSDDGSRWLVLGVGSAGGIVGVMAWLPALGLLSSGGGGRPMLLFVQRCLDGGKKE